MQWCALHTPRLPGPHAAHAPDTARQHSMNSPSAFFMMLALCSAVMRARLWSRAYENAYSATRVLATRVMTWRRGVP
jgi:hypothetical protein